MVPANRDHIRERSRLDFAPGVLAICAGQVKDTHHFLDGTDPVCSLDAPRVSSASILGSEWMDRHSIESFGVGARFHFGLSKTELGRRRARLPPSPPAEKTTARQDQAGQALPSIRLLLAQYPFNSLHNWHFEILFIVAIIIQLIHIVLEALCINNPVVAFGMIVTI